MSLLVLSYKYHRLCGLMNRNLFSHSPRGQNSQIKELADSVPEKGSLPGLQITTFSLCPNMTFSLCIHWEQVVSLESLLIRMLILSDQGPTIMNLFNLNYFLIDPISKYIYTEGVRASTYAFWENIFRL